MIFLGIFMMLKHGFTQKIRFFRLTMDLLWIFIPHNYEFLKQFISNLYLE